MFDHYHKIIYPKSELYKKKSNHKLQEDDISSLQSLQNHQPQVLYLLICWQSTNINSAEAKLSVEEASGDSKKQR